MPFDDVVLLVPGFLGFSRLGEFYYFADRVSAALRGALQATMQRTIPVVPVSSLPSDRLANRQEWLIRSIAGLCDRMGGVSRLHLVGHSAGGVDAQLLTCDRPLGRSWWSADEHRLRAKIKSVVSIASPHHGTCLSNAPLAKLIADPLRQIAADPIAQVGLLPVVARQLWDFSRLARSESEMIYTSLLARMQESSAFLWNVIRHRGLINDLAPRPMESIRHHWGKGSAPLRSFVTVTPLPRDADPFFEDLYRLTSDTSASPTSGILHRAAALLNERRPDAIRSSQEVPRFDDRVNDGVVNSARQLLDPSDPDELAGIVVADHADVLGHYDRTDIFMDGAPLNLGLFHSGAGFTDNQFYTLYGRVAEALTPFMC